jgi:phosphatidate phosphatase PAH1
MKRLSICVDDTESSGKPQSWVFVTPDWHSCSVLVVLVQNCGHIGPGVWSSSLIIDDRMEAGSMISDVDLAVNKGWGVVIVNPNLNEGKNRKNGKTEKVAGSENPESHGLTVWDHVIAKAHARRIVFLAHQFGGHMVFQMALRRKKEFLDRVTHVALVDSAHVAIDITDIREKQTELQEFFEARNLQWKSSDLHGNSRMPKENSITCLSSGVPDPTKCSVWNVRKFVFDFFSRVCPDPVSDYVSHPT